MNLKTLYIDYTAQNEGFSGTIPVSFEVFGPSLGTAPIVVVNHALTGNSSVAGEKGWWKPLIGDGKCIDTKRFTVLAFNIPGNGYDGFILENHEDFSVYNVSQLFLRAITQLKIEKVHSVIGGSLGGSLAWQMAVLRPKLFENIIPIATDWKATDWLLANCRVQKQILKHSINPVHDARMHAMTFYRTPESLKQKFNRSFNEKLNVFNVESWLLHHGEKLKIRFQLQAYKTMNHLLTTVNIAKETGNFLSAVKNIKGNVHLIGVDTDLFFTNKEVKDTYHLFKTIKSNVYYHELNSVHGHDAFLMEFQQLQTILQPIFSKKNIRNEYNNLREEHTRTTISIN
ncbi:alpha/beta fold hydrolase [Marixanthomonas spongiae]|uniref:Homoserine acetyltransferase n=1 Tax=Marixanthomonas spongiae TaxID=2174845 RepID=A0A2U0I7N3_9FLAO|nr:alpha/beta fold hydrolase [Marixanthomonas spongiae]PVW17113.1 homoserine acetyltransferase [Marixanthomonas spongiae]